MNQSDETSIHPLPFSEEDERIISLALLAGTTMLKYGGETYRAEECTRSILKAGNADSIEILAVPTSMIVTVRINGVYHTRSSSLKERDINLGMIDRANTVSRKLCDGTMTIDEAYAYLEEPPRNRFTPYLLGLFSALSSTAFTMLFGGTPKDMLFCFLAAVITNVSLKFFKKTTGHSFISALFGSIAMAAISRVTCIIASDVSLSAVITGGIMPMLPGIAITNAVRDTINGDLVSGSSKTIEALLQAVGIAVGVSVVLAV